MQNWEYRRPPYWMERVGAYLVTLVRAGYLPIFGTETYQLILVENQKDGEGV